MTYSCGYSSTTTTQPQTTTNTPVGSSPAEEASGADDAIAKMEATFDRAIEKSAKITEITTEKKTELDATKQRPQN